MKFFLTKHFKLSFLLSCFFSIPLFSSVPDILQLCDSLDTRIIRVKGLSDDVAFRIRSISYALGDGRNLTWKDIYGMSQALTDLEYINNNLIDMSSEVGQIRAYANSLDVSTNSTNSTDLTEIITRLDILNTVVSNLNNEVGNIKELYMDYMAWFTENQDKLSNYLDNWGNFTNSLPDNVFYGFFTNKLSRTQPSYILLGSMPSFRYNRSSHTWQDVPNINPSVFNPFITPSSGLLNASFFKNLSDYLLSINYNQIAIDGGILSTLYTNTQNTISFHRDYQRDFKSYSDFTTNKIYEIVSIFNTTSPLERINEDSNPSNIYNFVTNYYIKVSTNPSGSADENHTNWFNRVEMLLAALVFRPQEVAPSNDFSNVKDNEKRQFEDSIKDFLDNDIGDIQQNSENVLSDFEKTKTSLLSFFSHLNNSLSSLASIPSHIKFFQIDTSNGVRCVEISTQGTLATFADTLRAITTLCWMSFFIVTSFLLSRWLFIKFSSILKFCYSVFKTLIGIG